MEAKHTPAPWSTERPYGEPGLFVCRSDRAATNPLICRVREGTKESEANARLIAAAPDMLYALQAIETWTSSLPPMEGMTEQEMKARQALILMRAALTKATTP
jgi:hypothetical protein